MQLGITLVGIFAGAFGGATLAEKLAQPLAQITWLAPYAKQVSIGFVVKALGRVPREGETVEAQGYVFEILDMDGHRVDKVLVMPAKTAGSDRAAK